jgi:hypothetical protein
MIDAIGMGLYAVCVDFMIRFANALHMTYRDANASLFFLLWPAVTVTLAVVRARQRRTLAKLEAELDAAMKPAANHTIDAVATVDPAQRTAPR